ncbi:MAG: TonB-dependent receptor [Sulfurimonas sp.]|nr:TonB-dependent receptor [Sulfurimonas sp.]
MFNKSLIISLLLLGTVHAHSLDYDELFELSLEELMDIEVTTVSQKKEKVSDSLAIVSVMTAKQLKQTGALTLYEAISFLPGVQLNESFIGYTVLTFRGITPGLYNNKVLFMINGHPLHEKLFGSSHLEFLPLEMVERIEVVRSPASVLYGTNAIAGVVNVITKQGEKNKNEVAIRGGSYNHAYGSLSLHSANISMGASYQNDDGYNYGGTKDENGNDINKPYQNDLKNIFLDVYGEQWRVQASYFSSQKEKLGLTASNEAGGINDYESFYLDANKAFTLGSGELNLWLRYDYMDKKLNTLNFPANPTTVTNVVDRLSAQLQYKDKLSDDLDYIVGGIYEHDKTDPLLFVDQTDGSIHPASPFKEKYTTTNIALYTQVQYSFTNKLKTILGLRYEDNSDSGANLNPRLGLNYHYSTNTKFKLLYSEAYRSPTFLEKYANASGVLLGQKELKRENIHTTELGIDTKLNKRNSLQVTLYHTLLQDEITRRPTGNGSEVEYYNSDGIETYGVEVELTSKLSKDLELYCNTTYTDGKRLNHLPGDSNLDELAHYTANMILNYNFTSQWSSAISSQYISNKTYVLNSDESGEISSYNLSNLTLTYLNRPFEANLYLKNIFDEDYTYPENVRKNIKEIPGGPGASAYLNLRYYF